MSVKEKSQLLSRKIGLETVKGKLIVSLFAFAVIGGGAMVYTSFAADNTFYAPTTTCMSVNSGSKCRPLTDVAVGGDTSKNPNVNTVHEYEHTYSDRISTLTGGLMMMAGFQHSNVSPGQTYRVCSKIRPMSNTVIKVRPSASNQEGSWSVPPLTTYQNYCSPWISNNSSTNIKPTATITIGLLSKVRVANIYAEIGDAAQTPLSQPQPSKNP